MELTKVNEWLQIAAILGVLAGLGLIALEIKQNSDLMRAQLISETMDGWSDLSYSVHGEDIAKALAKAYEDAEALTTAELIQLDYFMWAQIAQGSREVLLNDMGLLPGWSRFGIADANLTFGNRFAQAWYLENIDGINEDIVDFMDQHMQEVSTEFNADMLARIRSRL